MFHLIPKVSAALWERWFLRDTVCHWTHDDLEIRPHPHPPATETEFRLVHPFPKRCANFGNERGNERGSLPEKACHPERNAGSLTTGMESKNPGGPSQRRT